jgi:F-type H+-transporting ATPase subunit epsilon
MGSALPLRRSQHLWIRRDSSDFLVAYPLERIIVVTITMSGKPVTTFWRMAGMSYLQYVNKAATSMRGALKEPAQRKAMEQEAFAYKVSTWQDGKQSPKVPVDVLAQSGATS